MHRYQERWGRALLKMLGEIHELRDRGEAVVGPESPPVEDGMSHACMRLAAEESKRQESFERAEQASGGEERVRDLTWVVALSLCEEPCSPQAGADPDGDDEQEAVTSQGSPARQKQNGQNKPTAERKTLARKGSCAQELVVSKAEASTGQTQRAVREGRDTHKNRIASTKIF